eukprot:1492478-Pyramimonas_sp.AAC.1
MKRSTQLPCSKRPFRRLGPVNFLVPRWARTSTWPLFPYPDTVPLPLRALQPLLQPLGVAVTPPCARWQ